MIRINLLPVKAKKRQEQGIRQLIAGAAVLAIWFCAVIFVNSGKQNEVNKARADNQVLSGAIAKLKAEIGDYDVIKTQREDLIRQRDAINRLKANRAGPVWLMRELSDILTKGKGPTFNKEQYEEQLKRDPNAGFNPTWEPKRVWMLSYEEKSHAVKLIGAAKSDEDVAEFLKRMKQSAFFSDVYWLKTTPAVDSSLNVSYVTFEVTCKVNY
jgi:type IV pilus assembly protein PilN